MIYVLFLVFYVNDKVRIINEKNKKALFHADKGQQEVINKEFDKMRIDLTRKSKKIMFYILIAEIFMNTLIIIYKEYYDLLGILGGILLPFFWYFVFIFFLLIAIGLKGQRVLQTGRFLKGLDY